LYELRTRESALQAWTWLDGSMHSSSAIQEVSRCQDMLEPSTALC